MDPIACTLQPADYRRRNDELTALAQRALRSREQTDRGERLVFADSAGTEQELRAAIAAEASCCVFLELELERTADGLVLEITGPQDVRPMIAQLFA
jgi:hypothetical protein